MTNTEVQPLTDLFKLVSSYEQESIINAVTRGYSPAQIHSLNGVLTTATDSWNTSFSDSLKILAETGDDHPEAISAASVLFTLIDDAVSSMLQAHSELEEKKTWNSIAILLVTHAAHQHASFKQWLNDISPSS